MYKLQQEIVIPKIPSQFLNNPLISQVLASTLQEFNFEEQAAIFLYCVIDLPIKEISEKIELSILYVTSTLVLFSEKLSFKLGVFEGAVSNVGSKVSIKELFQLEIVKELQVYEFDKCQIKWKAATRSMML